MINFHKIRWKNLLSTGQVFIEVDLKRNPTTLIVGENGSGKSTILDALTFSLFGKAFRNINKPQLINSINEQNCLTEVEFSIGKKYFLVRRVITTINFRDLKDYNTHFYVFLIRLQNYCEQIEPLDISNSISYKKLFLLSHILTKFLI